MSFQSMGEMPKYFCPNFLQPFLETIDRRSYNGGSRSLFQGFPTLTEKTDPRTVVALILVYLEGMPSKAS